MKPCPKFTFGVGDRFTHGAHAQLQAFIDAKALGIDLTPVWNKSNREHDIISVGPGPTSSMRTILESPQSTGSSVPVTSSRSMLPKTLVDPQTLPTSKRSSSIIRS
jgi:hypothetical protein